MNLRTVVVDDEPRALALIVDYVNKTTSLDLVASFQNSLEALDYINNNMVDLLLLDIQMPDLNGLELLNSLNVKPLVILTTAHTEHAVEGFKLDVLDYLVKPVMFPQFVKAISKAVKYQGLLETKGKAVLEVMPATDPGYIFIKVDRHLHRLQIADIMYVEAYGDYVNVYPKGGACLMSLQTLTEMLTKLPEKGFVRVHRSYIVNLNHVDTVEKDHLFIGLVDISIGKSYRSKLFKLLAEV